MGFLRLNSRLKVQEKVQKGREKSKERNAKRRYARMVLGVSYKRPAPVIDKKV